MPQNTQQGMQPDTRQQDSAPPEPLQNALRRHGIAGLFTDAAGRTAGDAQPPLHTTLPVHSETGDAFAAHSTDSICPLPGGGAVAVCGTPHFALPGLSTQAADEGVAAAVASGYAEHGAGIFAHMLGAFACCIIDTAGQRALAAVDRFGRNTCYYRAGEQGFAFGSEADAVHRCAGVTAALSEQGVYHYVYFHMIPAPGSIYRGTEKLQAGHFVEYHQGECRVASYWQPDFRRRGDKPDIAVLQRELRDELRRALKHCLPREGRFGAFLSGGLDSSTVVGVMSELGASDAEAYAIGFAAEGYDEMPYARITAEHFGVKLNEYYVTPEDIVEALPMVAAAYDEPFGNSSALPAFFCARMARKKGVDRLLAGDGGDELFGGNERYLRQQVFRHYQRLPGSLRRGLLEPVLSRLSGGLPLIGKAKSYIAQANTPLPDRLQSYNFLHRHAASEIFTANFLRRADPALPLSLLRDIYQRPEAADELDRMLYLDWQNTLADNDLRKVTQMCAAGGVDVAYPLLDEGLAELSTRVPSEWKIRDGNLRHYYKEALRGWLPEQTIAKSKQGFGLPFGVWMRNYQPLRELAYDNLTRLRQRDIIRPDFIDRAIAMHRGEHAAYYGELVWILTVLELWLASRDPAHSVPED